MRIEKIWLRGLYAFLILLFPIYGNKAETIDLSTFECPQEVYTAAVKQVAYLHSVPLEELKSSGAFLELPFTALSCEDIVEAGSITDLVEDILSRGAKYYWVIPVIHKDVPSSVEMSCEGVGSACVFAGLNPGPSIKSAVYTEISEIWVEQKSAHPVLLSCTNCMALLHVPEVNENNLTPVSDGCAGMSTSNYPMLHKSHFEKFLDSKCSQVSQETCEKMIDDYLNAEPSLKKMRNTQSSLNNLNQLDEIKESILHHKETSY